MEDKTNEHLFFNILLADDDMDDCQFFREVLDELPFATGLTTVHDGEALMDHLKVCQDKIDVLFLDLNMPLKNGVECLTEIKLDNTLAPLPVIVFSTSYDAIVADELFGLGAFFYICKPPEFAQLKRAVLQGLSLVSEKKVERPGRQQFMFQKVGV